MHDGTDLQRNVAGARPCYTVHAGLGEGSGGLDKVMCVDRNTRLNFSLFLVFS